jgi:hypothetical protein
MNKQKDSVLSNIGQPNVPQNVSGLSANLSSDPGTNNQLVSSVEISAVNIIWSDSSLILDADHVYAFINNNRQPGTGNTTQPATGNTTQPVAGNTEILVVLWNNGEGVCRLVPLEQLQPAYNNSRPQKIRHMKLPLNAFDIVFTEIFNQQPGAYRVVGALDSNASNNNFLRQKFEAMIVSNTHNVRSN